MSLRSRFRGLPRWARWLLPVLLVLLVIYLILFAVMTSSAFSRFVLGQVEGFVPALRFSNVEGSFTQGLDFDLHYSEGGSEVLAADSRLVIQPDCFWQFALCIQRLRIDSLRVSLPPAEAETDAPQEDDGPPAALPEVTLPLDISLRSLEVGSLLIERDGQALYRMSELDSRLAFSGSTLQIEAFTARDDFCRWALQAQLSFINRYPLDGDIACESVAGFGAVELQLGGDLEQLQVALAARLVSDYTAEPASLQAAFSLAPLAADLPMALELQSAAPLALTLAGQTLPVESAAVEASGPLLSPDFSIVLQFETPWWQGGNRLTLSGAADTEALRIDALQLQLPEGALQASGSLNYAETLQWQAQLAFADLELAQFDPAMEGELHGRLNSSGELRDGEPLARLALEELSGEWLGRALSASGDFLWRDETLNIERFALKQADNRLQLAGRFSPAGPLDLSAEFALPQLSSLIPEEWAPNVSGELHGNIAVSGQLDDPVLRSDISLRELRYGEIRLASGALDLQWFGLSRRQGELDIRLNDLALSETLAANVQLQGEGNIEQHSFRFSLTGLREQLDRNLVLQCSGGFDELRGPDALELWDGQCGELQLVFPLGEESLAQAPSGDRPQAEEPAGGEAGHLQVWRLVEAFALQLRPKAPGLFVDAFCLSKDPARICSREAIRFADGALSDIRLSGEQLPLVWLEPLLPNDDLQLGGSLQFRFHAAELMSEPQLMAQLSSDSLTADWSAGSETLQLAVTSLVLDWEMAAEQHQLRWELDTRDSGSSRAAVSLAADQIGGELAISGINLGSYAGLLLPNPEDALAGELNARLQLAGTMQSPVLSGQLSLSEGMFDTELLPVPLQDIQLELTLDDNRAEAAGSFRAAQSEGRIGGNFAWDGGEWSGALSVAAEPLMVQPQPGMRLSVAPDLRFSFAPSRIVIAGDLRVPEAQLEITELPEQAVSVSSDAVIIGDTEAGGPGMQIATDLQLVLGDKVFFEGFGLETKITGSLRLQQQAGELLRANGKLQLVEGRYKAYGQNLLIRSGDLVFVGDVDNPQLRLEAVRADTPETVVVGLRASGPASNPRIALFSTPDMPQQAQLSYLLTGNPPGTDVETDPQLAAAEAALSYALESDLGAGITRRAGDALGIEDLKVTAGATDEGTQIGLSGYITPNLLVRYGVGVFDAINTLTLRYQVTKSVYLEAISGENSDLGVMWTFERD